MADEDVTLDGKPLQSLRVADLKAALEQRNLPKSGPKNTLIKRLKGALMLENLQKSSSSHIGLQPNSQIGEEMSQNSFIKQYLAKQQELLRQRLEREAQQAAEADESPAAPEDDEDHSEDNDSSSYITDKHCVMPSQPLLNRAAEEGGGGPVMGPGMMACRSDMGAGSTHHLEAPGVWMQRSTIQSGHEEPPTPSPPRAVASLSVRVLGQPDRQGLPPAVPRAQEKEGTAPVEPGSAHPVLHLSRSAGDSAGAHIHDDSDEDDDDESEEDEDWGPSPSRARRVSRAPAQPLQPSPSIPSAAARSRRKLQPPQHIPPLQKANKGQGAEKNSSVDKGAERRYPTKREVSEPSAAAVTEVDPDSENSMSQQPASEAEPDNNSESRLEESTTPKAFAARKISLTSSKTSPASTEGGTAGAGESETGTAAGRKRRWGSSTSVTAKKPSISITTDSLKSLIPDIKVSQEAVVELHPEELQLSGDEEGLDTSRDDQDKGLKIRRTVTQVVPGDSQENGQGNEEEDDVEKMEKEKQRRTSKDKRKNSHSEETLETQTSVKHDAEAKKVTPSDSLVRRSISQQKSGVSITIDDPVRTTRQPSPPRGKVSNIIHVTNLVRPFTLGQLKELLNRTGSVVEEGFWIDKIKSHCYVTYLTTEEAVATRAALHGVKWPQSNPKVLSVDFCEQDELDFHKGLLKPDRGEEDPGVQPGVPQTRLPPLMPERDRDRERDRERERERDRGMGGVRDQWAEREREMERRERARGEREWDRDKIREFGRPGEESRRSRSRDRERRRRERGKSKERRSDKKEKDEPPAKLLDDLFLKTKAAPCIYWLPLTEEQAAQRVLDRAERQKERERKRKEQQEEEDKKREEEKKERLKGREKEGGVTASSGGAGRGDGGDRERDRGRDRDRDGEKKRDGYRPRRPSGGVGSGRRSRSRSNPRDRRR
ncbi:apoptotic chromatin condensation inducer 1b isoform X2 [Myripristis murdjan]|uniref:apoptotic chromatin condensation inducer 1b isoform X2 n=1 Tax=Myripristis murdjan TaxID=586833 RepID=UPI0011761CC9|nr:apoptotic chromatin condensation inducer in the nucleus isoform X2 [Myripristis murdjan]